MNFYLSLFVFILSLVTGLILMIAAKGLKREKFLLLSSVHGMFLLAFLASLLLHGSASVYNYFFMTFICSGLVLSGIAWRSDAPGILRIYFSLFALTIPLFLFSPSMLLNFLLTMHYRGSNEPPLQVTGSYFLEKQSVSKKMDDQPYYKLIRKKGLFHQTLQRDIDFGGRLDSIKLIEFSPGESLTIRGYTSIVTHVSSDIDSADIPLRINTTKPGAIEYHL
jgi:hypothetical protein